MYGFIAEGVVPSPGSSPGGGECLTLADGAIGSVPAGAPKVFRWEPLLVC